LYDGKQNRGLQAKTDILASVNYGAQLCANHAVALRRLPLFDRQKLCTNSVDNFVENPSMYRLCAAHLLNLNRPMTKQAVQKALKSIAWPAADGISQRAARAASIGAACGQVWSGDARG
jgi:hypothetical protein